MVGKRNWTIWNMKIWHCSVTANLLTVFTRVKLFNCTACWIKWRKKAPLFRPLRSIQFSQFESVQLKRNVKTVIIVFVFYLYRRIDLFSSLKKWQGYEQLLSIFIFWISENYIMNKEEKYRKFTERIMMELKTTISVIFVFK